MTVITDSITGGCKLKAYRRRNITGVNFIQLRPLVCMHLQDTSHTFLFIFSSVQYIRTGVHCTGINSEERQLTHEGIRHDLKCQSGERLIIRRMSLHLVAVQIRTLDSGDIGRSRHILQDCIEKLLYSLISVCGTAADRDSGTFAGCLSQSLLHILYRRLLTLQIHHCQVVIQFADLLNKL